MEVAEILREIPKKLTDKLAAETGVDHSVQRLRGRVFLDLLLFGLINSERLSTHVMEEFYNSKLFEYFSDKDKGHQTRHSSIADRLKVISPDYFKAILEWAFEHFFDQFGGTKREKKLKRFDSTMIKISSALVDWGMRVGRPPKDRPQQVQLKVTLGLKGAFPKEVNIYTNQKDLSEENTLYDIIINNSHEPDEIISFDLGLKSRKSLQEFDNEGIKFVTKGAKNLRYKVIRPHSEHLNENDQTRILQDSIVQLYADGIDPFEHEFRLIEIKDKESGNTVYFITNILKLSALTIADIYRRRWDIEVFFRFIKQELNIKHLLSHSLNGIKVQIYVTLLLAILLTVYTISNNLKGYKIPKIKFREELTFHIIKELVKAEKILEHKIIPVF